MTHCLGRGLEYRKSRSQYSPKMVDPPIPPMASDDAGSLGDRTLDRLLGVGNPELPPVQLPPPLSGNPKKDWDSYSHRESSVGDRARRRMRLRQGLSPETSIFDLMPDVISWTVSAAVVAALLYLVWWPGVFPRGVEGARCDTFRVRRMPDSLR